MSDINHPGLRLARARRDAVEAGLRWLESVEESEERRLDAFPGEGGEEVLEAARVEEERLQDLRWALDTYRALESGECPECGNEEPHHKLDCSRGRSHITLPGVSR